MTMIQISSAAPSAVPAGFVPVIARTRISEKQKTIPASQRQRALLMPDLILDGLPSKFVEFTRNALHEVAKKQLAEAWKQQGDALIELHSSLFTADGLLMYAARESESKRLTAETVRAALLPFVQDVIDDTRQTQALAILASMAAPAKAGNEKQLFSLHDKLTAWLEEANDEAPIAEQVAVKLLARANELKAQRESFETDGGF